MTTKIELTSHSERLSCMEVWGGNNETDAVIDRPGVTCRVRSRSYGSVDGGGDVYFLSSCSSGRLTRFLLADVCGHGESAAETAIGLRDLMRRNVNRIRQRQLMQSVNRELAAADTTGRFATALVGTWMSSAARITLSNAGHPTPLLYRAATQAWSECVTQATTTVAMQNMPLGIDSRVSYSEFQIKLKPGDLLLCYTDALSESVDENGNYLQTSGLANVVRSLGQPRVESFVTDLLGRLTDMAADNLDRDDVTVMLFEATNRPVPVRDSLLAPWRYLQGLMSDRVTSRIPGLPATPELASTNDE